MNIEDALRRLAALQLPIGDFAVFGSGPLLVRGIIGEANDLDVVARGAAWDLARERGTLVHLDEHDVTVASFDDGAVTVGSAWAIGDVDIDELIDTAEPIDGIPYATLTHVIAYKKVANRPKDVEHLRLIRAWLDSGRS